MSLQLIDIYINAKNSVTIQITWQIGPRSCYQIHFEHGISYLLNNENRELGANFNHAWMDRILHMSTVH